MRCPLTAEASVQLLGAEEANLARLQVESYSSVNPMDLDTPEPIAGSCGPVPLRTG